MTREQMLERAVKALNTTARKAVVAQERWDYWKGFGTNSNTSQRAESKHAKMIEELGNVELMAQAALKGDEDMFDIAERLYRDKV